MATLSITDPVAKQGGHGRRLQTSVVQKMAAADRNGEIIYFHHRLVSILYSAPRLKLLIRRFLAEPATLQNDRYESRGDPLRRHRAAAGGV